MRLHTDMSPIAYSGPAVPPSNKSMAPTPRNNAIGGAGKGLVSGVPHRGYSGPKKAPFRHIDDIVSVDVDLDPHTPLRKVIEIGDKHMQQAITYEGFGPLDLALQEYIKAFTIAVDKVPKHKEYPSLRSDRGDLNRSYRALKVKITKNSAVYDRIKELIKEDNLRSGVYPERAATKSPRNLPLDLPSVPTNLQSQQSVNHDEVHPETSIPNGKLLRHDPQVYDGYGAGRITKPIVHPKPQALHGNSIRPVSDKASPDLVARFAKLRDPLASRNSSSSPPLAKPIGPRAMPLQYRPPPSVHNSFSDMPKIPDAIYSPARGTVTSETANLPSSTPRGMFSRTNSIVSMSGTSSRTSMESVLKTVNREQFVTAHSYGDIQASSMPSRHIPEGELITVKELVRFMDLASENANIKLLLIDVRDRQLFDEGHIMSQNTICLDPTILSRQNISASEIVDSMILAPANEKLAFERRDEVDLIVFYDQDSEFLPQNVSSDTREAVIFNLRQALVHYSYSKQLAHAPKLLVGGIETWVVEMGQSSLQTSDTQSIPRSATSSSISARKRLRNRTLKPEEVNSFEAMIGRDETGDFDYTKSRDDFMRRFPSLREPESMVSNERDGSSIESTGSGGEEFLKDMTPVPPIRPKPSVARTRYSGLESADEHSPGGLAMMATPAPGSPKPTGLINPGNWCYANASIQALLASTDFSNEFLDPQWPTKYRPAEKGGDPAYNQLLCRILGNLFQWLSQRSFRTMKASTLMHYLRTIHTGYQVNNGQAVRVVRFGDTQQHDSDELITFMFGQLESETLINMTGNTLPTLDITEAMGYVIHIWEGHKRSIVKKHWFFMELQTMTCHNCKSKNFSNDVMDRWQLIAPYDNNNGTFAKSTRAYFQPYDLGATCEKCKSTGKYVTKRIARLPPMLRVGLVRTDQTSSIKTSKHFAFPFDDLDLKEYCLESSQRRQLAKLIGGEAADGFDGNTTYHLVAVVMHAGSSLHSGHFVTAVRQSNDTWVEFNDERVFTKPTGEMMTFFHECREGFTPVQLFYKRNKDSPAGKKKK